MKNNVIRILFLLISFFILVCFFKKNNFEEAQKAKYVYEIENKSEIEKSKTEEKIYIGNFVLTAYCPCVECCGEWAYGRPLDENGKEIVYGSSGQRLEQGVSIAVDPSVITYGTRVEIDGGIYIAQDCGGAIKENRIDVYFENHSDALSFGVQTKPVYIIEG